MITEPRKIKQELPIGKLIYGLSVSYEDPHKLTEYKIIRGFLQGEPPIRYQCFMEETGEKGAVSGFWASIEQIHDDGRITITPQYTPQYTHLFLTRQQALDYRKKLYHKIISHLKQEMKITIKLLNKYDATTSSINDKRK